MPITTLSSREFNQDTSRAKKAAEKGPVFITDRGTPAHVLLSIEEYQRLTGGQGNLIDQLGLPAGVEDVELEIPPPRDRARAADSLLCRLRPHTRAICNVGHHRSYHAHNRRSRPDLVREAAPTSPAEAADFKLRQSLTLRSLAKT